MDLRTGGRDLLLAIAGITTTTTTGANDCEAGVLEWEGEWSARKKEWCCEHHGFGCPAMVAEMPTATTTAAYDCRATSPRAQSRWSGRRREWCCFHKGRGCPSTTSQAPPLAFGCRPAGAPGWPAEEQVWCCQHEGLGCPDPATTAAPTTTTTRPPSAAATAAAPTTTTTRPPSAPATAASPTTTAAPAQTTTSPAPPYNCGSDLPDCDRSWSSAKKQWCHEREGVACPAPAAEGKAEPSSELFDCLSGYATWSTAWSVMKSEWCCSHHGRACADDNQPVAATTVGPPTWAAADASQPVVLTDNAAAPYDCAAPDPSLWEAAKAEWCCAYQGTGCETGNINQKFDDVPPPQDQGSAPRPGRYQWWLVLAGAALSITAVAFKVAACRGRRNSRRAMAGSQRRRRAEHPPRSGPPRSGPPEPEPHDHDLLLGEPRTSSLA